MQVGFDNLACVGVRVCLIDRVSDIDQDAREGIGKVIPLKVQCRTAAEEMQSLLIDLDLTL